MKSCISRFKGIALFGNMHSARFTLALAESIWFATLIWPGDTFDRPTYHLMSAIASEAAWSAIFAFTALAQWYILFSGRYHDRFSVVFAAYNAILWWWVCISMYLSVYPLPAAISGELALAFAATWVFVRSGITKQGRQFDD